MLVMRQGRLYWWSRTMSIISATSASTSAAPICTSIFFWFGKSAGSSQAEQSDCAAALATAKGLGL